MKKIVVVLSGILLVAAALPVGCAPMAAPATQNITGTITNINTPGEAGQDVVTVQTPQGEQTFTITPNTTISLQGTACPIEEAGRTVDQGNVTYNCTIEYDEYYNAIAVGIWKAP